MSGTWVGAPGSLRPLSPCASHHVTSLGSFVWVANPKSECSGDKSGSCSSLKTQAGELSNVTSLELYWPKQGTGATQIQSHGK